MNKYAVKSKTLLKKNKNLLGFISLSYLDKAIVFLVPLFVLYFFKDKAEYVFIEYIYSIVLILVPFLDFGLSGYFYFEYRSSKNKRKSIVSIITTFFAIYIVLFLVGIILIFTHYFIYPFEPYIVYIVFRVLFLVSFAFLASYYRLIDNAKKALFITMVANLISLAALVLFFVMSIKLNLMAVFIGQILFCIFFMYKTLNFFIKKCKNFQFSQFKNTILASILFSWPSIIQVFLMMFIANYGKIKALNNLTIDESTLLSLTQRYATLIQLTHASILAFLMKELYLSKEREIKSTILIKYLILLLSSVVIIIGILFGHWMFNTAAILPSRIFNISLMLVLYTLFWCVYSYFEMYYSIENKNIIKLYLALLNGLVFIGVLTFLPAPFLERVALGMVLSILVSLAASAAILKTRKYYFT